MVKWMDENPETIMRDSRDRARCEVLHRGLIIIRDGAAKEKKVTFRAPFVQ